MFARKEIVELNKEEFNALLEEAFIAGYEDATEEIFTEDSKQKNANKTLGRQLHGSAIPGSGIRGVKDINKRYRHANRQFIRLHKKVGENSYEKDPKKVNTPDEKKKYNKLANKVTGLYDAREKYFKKSVDDLYTDDNFADYLKKARKSPNLRARIVSNDKYNKLNDKAKEFLKKKYGI